MGPICIIPFNLKIPFLLSNTVNTKVYPMPSRIQPIKSLEGAVFHGEYGIFHKSFPAFITVKDKVTFKGLHVSQ